MDTGHKCFSAVVQATAKIRPRPAQGSFFWKNFIQQLKLFLKWMLIESWRRASMLRSMCQHVARLQFDSCAEKDSLCGTVMIHDGLNWKCLDQCHGVRSHGKSSSHGWRKIVVQSEFDPWVYIIEFSEDDLCRFAWEGLLTEAGLCRHQGLLPYSFYMIWRPVLKSVMLIQGGGGSHSKSSIF